MQQVSSGRFKVIPACCIVLIFLFANNSVAQNQYNIWYFGTNAGIDFNAGAPVAVLNSTMPFTEGCATYCNSVGQLLFYTNGGVVVDKTHSLMLNGNLALRTGLNPVSSMQNSVVVPMHNDTNKYYLFVNAGQPTGNTPGVLFHTTIDMTLNSGNGAVGNSIDTLAFRTSERMVGVKHCNGLDHWIVTHKQLTDSFFAFRVTTCGVMDTVISVTGPTETNGSNFAPLKASPKANKLSTVIDGVTLIYDFDNATGRLTGFTPIDTAGTGVVSIANMFSPDGNLFYLVSGANFPQPVYQFNLNAANISASKTFIANQSGNLSNFALGYDFQIGRDGKLYLSNSDLGALMALDAIPNPNTLGVGCGFVNSAISIAPRNSWLNLPNNISDYLDPLPQRPTKAGFTQFLGCAGSPTNFNDTSYSCTPIESYSWDFGDPSSGASNTSTAASPTHTYGSAGTYTVTQIVSEACYVDTAVSVITIGSAAPVSITGDTAICSGNSTSLSASATGAVSYAWAPSTGLSSSTGSSVTASPSTSTSYIVITTFPGGCSTLTGYNLNVDNPDVTSSGNTDVCTGDTATISVTGAASYQWFPSTGISATTGSSVSAFPTASTTYSIIGTSSAGCLDTLSLSVNVITKPVAQASSSSSICSGSNVTLTASGASTYSWFPSTGLSSTTGSSVTANPTTTTTYSVIVSSGPNCFDTSGMTITVNSLPVIQVNGTASICSGNSTVLTASGANTYSWSPAIGISNTTGSSVSANPSVSTSYIITGTDANGCSNTQSFSVTVLPQPIANAGSDKIICQGESASLSGSGGSIYQWSNGSGNSNITVSPTQTTVYTLTVSNGACSNTDAATVTVNPLPTANAGSSILIPVGGSATLSGSGGGSYLWSPSQGLSCDTCASPIANPSVTTIYYLTVTDGNGCTSNDSLIVTVDDICFEDFDIPNVITPNGDGINEQFIISGFDPCLLEGYHLSIYNRWGNLIFETNNPQGQFWDGTTGAGTQAPDGTYYYILLAKDDDIKGFVMLIR